MCERLRLFVVSLLAVICSEGAWASTPAFPGAEGYGSETTHARGKKVFHVTRLDDEKGQQKTKSLKPGQFRRALAEAEEAGGGYIVFDVAGTIRLKETPLIPSNTYIAGQSAPGTGISIEGAQIWVGRWKAGHVHDVLVRHLRFRGRGKKGSDAFAIHGPETHHVVFDHLSVSYFQDGAVDIKNEATDVTLQWCHFGDAADSGTNEPYHGEPHLVDDRVDRVTMHHNFYTHSHSRVPWVTESCENVHFEFSNNVVYNSRKYPSRFDARRGKVNAIGNFYIPGKNTHSDSKGKFRPVITGANGVRIHVRDNLAVGGIGHDNKDSDGKSFKGKDQHIQRGKEAPVNGPRPDKSLPEERAMGGMGSEGTLGPVPGVVEYSKSRFDEMPKITYVPVEENLDLVLTQFGALPRDMTDSRLVKELLTRSGEWKLDIPDDGSVYEGEPVVDTDRDGMPDEWEKRHGRDLETNGHDLDPEYDNIEVYLNERAAQLVKDAKPVKSGNAIQRK